MFTNIVEFIQNSVTAIVTLTVGALGIGGNNVLDTQTANISDAVSSSVEEVVEVPESDSNLVNRYGPETEYFERVDIKPAVFSRPTSSSDDLEVSPIDINDEGESEVLVSDNQETSLINRLADLIEPREEETEIDNSLLLNANFDSFDSNLQIIKITEDDDYFYSVYKFKSFAIEGNSWEEVEREKKISVDKVILGDGNLENFLLEELGEVVNNEISFLKETQEIQKQKLLNPEGEDDTGAIVYNELSGKVLDLDSFQSSNEDTLPEASETEEEGTVVVDNTTDSGQVDNEAPIIIIQGNNPALIQIGSGYSDLGAKVTDNISNNLGIVVGGMVVDTNTKGSYSVIYTATDEAGNVATATREVIVYDYGAAPVIEEEEEEIVPEVVPEVVVEEEVIEEEETPAPAEVVVEEEEEEIVPEVVPEVVVEEEVIEEEETPAPAEVVVEEEEEEIVPEVVPEVVVEEEVVEEEEIPAPAEVVVEEEEEEIVPEVVPEVVVEDTKVDKKKGKKGNKVIEIVSETVEAISDGVEAVAEELSAMIKAVNLLEMLGNIRSALQASVSTASEGTSNSLNYIGYFFKGVIDGAVDIIQSGFSIISKSPQGGNVANISSHNNIGITENTNFFFDEHKLEEQTAYKKESFIGFVFKKVIAVPGKLVGGVTATVKDYGKVIGSDLEVAGNQINQKMDQVDLNPKGIIQTISDGITGIASGTLNFFKNHQPF
ncbi:MAG: DUF5011 domain-containing protein [Patescibacteria group bacterium]|nr:DUF5011 domain-containing protein [Patescibacteria group bacterium]